MIPTTLTQPMGNPPVAARRRGPVVGAFGSAAAHRHATRPYAGTAVARCTVNVNGNWVLGSGFWVGSMAAATRTIKRPARPLAPRTT